MSGLEILSIAANATIQDAGRPGFLRYGLSAGGAVDPYALAEGQALLGNAPDDAALEFAGAGGRFLARSDVWLATSGAEMTLTVNGDARPWRQSFGLRAGDELRLGPPQTGVYAYLHVAGGFQTEQVLGSRSTHLRAGLGTVPRPGIVLPFRADLPHSQQPLKLPCPGSFSRRCFRVLPAPQADLFSAETRQRFLAQEFRIGQMRDRMGMRLEVEGSAAFQAETGLSIASDATNLGDVQITGDGTPVVLLVERGSAGGYPRLVTVISADLAALAQVPSGELIRFQEISRDDAVVELRKYRREINTLKDLVQPVFRDPHQISGLSGMNLIGGVIRGDEEDNHDDD